MRRASWLAAALWAVACDGPATQETQETQAAEATSDAGPPETASAAAEDPCAFLVTSAVPMDALTLARHCPDAAMTRVQARNALLHVRDGQDAVDALARLSSQPDLAGLAKLLALQTPPPAATLADPKTLVATPITSDILAQVSLAHAVIRDSQWVDEQTRARGVLAVVHSQALKQLGATAPYPPFARAVAGRALFYGRDFCGAYWRRRVAGLHPLVTGIEDDMQRTLRDLDQTPAGGDDMLLAHERVRVRRYLSAPSTLARVRSRRKTASSAAQRGPVVLPPLGNELRGLVQQGLLETAVDLARSRNAVELLRDIVTRHGDAAAAAYVMNRTEDAAPRSSPLTKDDLPVDPAYQEPVAWWAEHHETLQSLPPLVAAGRIRVVLGHNQPALARVMADLDPDDPLRPFVAALAQRTDRQPTTPQANARPDAERVRRRSFRAAADGAPPD